jgi:hypothetical protein
MSLAYQQTFAAGSSDNSCEIIRANFGSFELDSAVRQKEIHTAEVVLGNRRTPSLLIALMIVVLANRQAASFQIVLVLGCRVGTIDNRARLTQDVRYSHESNDHGHDEAAFLH